jgi:hypothetical protein
MEDNQKTTISFEIPSEEAIASKRNIPTISFGAVILLFFLSFCDLQCSGQKIASVSGFNLVTGKSFSAPQPGGGLDSAQRLKPNFFAIMALGMAICGLVVYVNKLPNESFWGMAVGAGGAFSLLVMRTLLLAKINGQSMGMVSLHFKFPFWLAIMCFIAAGGLSFLRWKLSGYILPQEVTNLLNKNKPNA